MRAIVTPAAAVKLCRAVRRMALLAQLKLSKNAHLSSPAACAWNQISILA